MRIFITFGIPAIASLCLVAAPAGACEYDPGRVYFSTGGAAVTARGNEMLDNQAVYFSVADSPGSRHRVWLTAHTDAAGSASANLVLSRKRAEAVRAYLIRKGVPASRIDIFSLGERAARTRRDDGTPAASDRFVEVEVVTPEEVASRSSNGRCG